MPRRARSGSAFSTTRAIESQSNKICPSRQTWPPAKVIRFPKALAGELPASNVNRRWLSVAAAAGLLIGLLGGQVVNLLPEQARRTPTVSSAEPATGDGPVFVPASVPLDDGFLGEIELVMERRGARLRALAIYLREPLINQAVSSSGHSQSELPGLGHILPDCPTAGLLFPYTIFGAVVAI